MDTFQGESDDPVDSSRGDIAGGALRSSEELDSKCLKMGGGFFKQTQSG